MPYENKQAHMEDQSLIQLCIMLTSVFWFFLATPNSMCHLSPPTRDRSHACPHWKDGVLTPGPPGKSYIYAFAEDSLS